MMLPEDEILYNLENTHWWFMGMNSIMDKILVSTIKPDSKLLDVGCNPGQALSDAKCSLSDLGYRLPPPRH
jgi:hypothetical protein